MGQAAAQKTIVVGLDCAEPSLVLERWRDRLPVLSGLAERGVSGRLTSVVPPITVPAWSCMMSSRTPGDLGIYGFRNRSDHTYDGAFIADGSAVRAPRLWDLVGRGGGSSVVLGVPGTFPPRPLRGAMVGCFLTPSLESRYTYPPALRDEIREVVGDYLFDCTNFRTEDKDDLLRQVYEMTDKRFALAEHLVRDEAVAALRDGRDGHRPDPPRLLEAHGRRASQARARQPLRARDPRLLRARRRADRQPAASTSTTTRSSSSSPTTARSGSTAASASTSGCAARACS